MNRKTGTDDVIQMADYISIGSFEKGANRNNLNLQSKNYINIENVNEIRDNNKKRTWDEFGKGIFLDVSGYISNYEDRPTENYKEEVSVKMDENKILEKYMDSVSQNIRDMEKRLGEERKESEKRITEERHLSEDRMEKRYSDSLENTKLTEARIEKNFNEAMQAIKEQNNKIDSAKTWIIGVCLTTIVGIAAMVVNVILKTH